jgi:flagellar biosynthetic protein FliR
VNPLSGLEREVVYLMLESLRVAGVVFFAPLPWLYAPVRLRAAIVAVLTLAVHGVHPIERFSNAAAILITAPTEVIVGVAMAFVVRVCLSSIEIANDLITTVMGLNAMPLFDPKVQVSETPIGQLVRNVFMLIALSVGLHRVVLLALFDSYAVLPAGRAADVTQFGPFFRELTSAVLVGGVQMALPVVSTIVVAQVGLAFIARAAPPLQIFSVGFAVTISLGAYVLYAALTDIAYDWVRDLSLVASHFDRLFLALLAR